ncbi:FCD domain-containing protein [Alphaproteobacteria bacterium GH1-50]|uniref:FCD domain-containing protein n=1 Tax=Kangsaoukella pontilimi TaxID=2691042 RepID=A0A7C9N2B1_9RHOB|nr:GntR family transcriptional regulator [Kangsaoukella pontilimi]MXQ09258.1 FCD domain-containing protein [Kangsaoukella pontilimi]
MTTKEPVLARARGQTLTGKIETALRLRILSGDLPPGAKLSLDRLKNEYSVSLSALREAVTRLASDGLLEVEEQRGYRVAPISLDNLAEVTRLRMELEPLALRQAIANGGIDWETDVMAALYRLNRTGRDPKDQESLEVWEAAHNAFHLTLIDRCDMPLLLRMCGQLSEMYNRYRHLFLSIKGEQRDLAAEHTEIAESAVARDADRAAALLRAHIEKTGAALKARLEAALPGQER